MQIKCITNNPILINKGLSAVEAFDGNPLELLKKVREEILKGHKLVTHPLTGSINIAVNPYKSVILDINRSTIDQDSLNIIEKAIFYAQNLINIYSTKNWDELSLRDLQLIDFYYISSFF